MTIIKKAMAPISVVLCFVLLLTSLTFGWGSTGHKVIARIAWENMKPATRAKVVAILRAAPADSGLMDLCKGTDVECFENAAVWADIIKSNQQPDRRDKYSHGTWHYRDSYWEPTASGPKDRPDIKPDSENAIERLYFFQAAIGGTASDSEKAIMIAWVLHIGGDIHQPLHTSGRVTETEPKGDAGGNGFKLGEGANLHGYWDGIIDRIYPKNAGEADVAYYDRLAATIMKANPKDKFKDRMKAGDFEVWAMEGFKTTKASLYPPTLKRDQTPDADYQKMADSIAEPAVALAGYRLAEMLDRLVGN